MLIIFSIMMYQHRMIKVHKGGISFSKIEIKHLLISWLAISFAFTIVLGGLKSNFLFIFITSLVTVGSGFLFHELAHKFVAQKYYYHAEYRANYSMLLLAIIVSFLGFIFAAPGAVMIMGHVNRKEYGKISLAGPATNFVLALIFLAISILTTGLVQKAAGYGFMINAWVGVFNMIPFGPLDGAKIYRWSKPVYFSVLAIGLLMVFFSFL